MAIPACADDGNDAFDSSPSIGAAGAAATVAPAALPPIQPSKMITSLTWNYPGRVRLAVGSDLWPLTQAADGSIFGGWGDGGGFQGTDQNGRVSMGFAKMTGTPPNLTGTNTWGGQGFAQNVATFCGKPTGMIAVGSTIYAWVATTFHDVARCGPEITPVQHKLAMSTDNGAHFTEASLAIPETTGTIFPISFLNYGKNNAGARDGFVYSIAAKVGDGAAYLIRATPANLPTTAQWQYFAGFDTTARPVFSASASAAQPIFSDPVFGPADLTYHPATNRYLLTGQGAGIQDYALYEGPQPWGPWSSVFTTRSWGPAGAPFGQPGGTIDTLGVSYPEAWMSGDGKTIWAAFSSGGGSPVGDALNLMSATLTLANQGVTIKAPTAYAQTQAVVGNPVYTDRAFTVNALSSNLAGGELIQLANDDKLGTSAAQLTFTITNAQTVYVAYDPTLSPIASWLSTWTKDTASVFKWNNTGSGTVASFDVYKKSFPAGSTVTLGGNVEGTGITSTSHSNYIVVVR